MFKSSKPFNMDLKYLNVWKIIGILDHVQK